MLAGLAVAVAHERQESGAAASPAETHAGEALPEPDAKLPSDPRRFATRLTATMRRLRHAVARWDPADAPPEDVTYLALQHQRMLRLMARRRALGDASRARL